MTDVKGLVATWRALMSWPEVNMEEIRNTGTAMADALEALKANLLEALKANLDGRDDFIGDQGLWDKFVGTLHPPPGWQLVPKEPTDKMIAEALSAYARNGPRVGRLWGSEAVDMYRAMLAAAPSPDTVRRGSTNAVEATEGYSRQRTQPQGHAAPSPQQTDGWQPIEMAPKDGTLFLVWCPEYEGLSSMYSLCAWHSDAGFCVDELRSPTHWRPLPAAPSPQTEGGEA